MAETRLSNMIIPQLFNDYVMERTAQLSRLRQSGIIQDMSELLGDKLGGTTVNMPYFKDLTGTDDVVDDTANLTINNITTSQDVAVKLYRAKVFGATDLSADLSGADPMMAIATLFAEWWSRQEQSTLLKTLEGAFAAASMSGNVLDITGLAGAAQNFDADSFLDAIAKLGDAQDSLAGILVHGDTYRVMKGLDLIDFIKPSDGGQPIPTWMGHYVLVDDTAPKDASSPINYTTYVFGNGSVGYAQAPTKTPVEVGREPLQGGGTDYIVNRKNYVMHPRGVKWKGTPSGSTPANSELAVGTNWERVWENKNVKIIKFVHNLNQT
jgi:hypothetical protein